MKLTYTYIRLDDGRRLIVPNERLAQSSVVNHTIVDPRVQVEVSVWLPPDADLDKAMELIADEDAGHLGDRCRDRQGGRPAQRHDLGLEPRASAGGPRPSCARDGSVCCASTHYPQRRPERGFAPELLMTQRQRKSRRRRRHTGRNSVLLGLGVLAVVAVIGVLVRGRLRARHRRHGARPRRAEAGRQGPALRRLRRRRLAARLHPVRRAPARRPVARHPREPAPRHRRDRGRALLQARRRGLQRHRARRHQEPRVRQDRAGRLDDHPAARPRALHQGPEAQLHPQDPRGQAGLRARGRALEDLDPPQLPQLGARTARSAAAPRSASRPPR